MLAASYWLPPDISEHGHNIDQLINFVHYFMAVLFVGWGIYFVYCLVRFRARSGHTANYELIKAKPSKVAEIVVVVIEGLLLVFLAMPVWASYRSDPPARDQALEVRIIGQQFAWNIHYAGADGKFGRTRPDLIDETMNPIGLDESDEAATDDIVEINNFRIPKDKDVLVRLTSKDVIHSFSVPVLRIKQDAIPGMEIPIWFKATANSDELRLRFAVTAQLPSGDEGLADFAHKYRKYETLETYGGVESGTAIDEESAKALTAAGVSEVSLGPTYPANIQCAQLCGLGHYRMMGQLIILDQEDFDAWLAEAAIPEEFDEDDFDD